jgi:hypothetical protein
MLRKTTSVPPKYFPYKSCVLEIGFDRSKSILPFSSITGIKLDEENIASRRHKFDSGAVIANCILVIISARTILLSEGFIPEMIESVFNKLKTIANPIIKISEMAAKKIKTFRAKASLKVYQEIIKIFFMSYFSYQLH